MANEIPIIEQDELPPGCKAWPTGEVELPRFFILDEHEFTDEKTGEKVNLDQKRLEHIVARLNTRRKRTGDMVPICAGHTKDQAVNEFEQPPIVGYAIDFALEAFYDTGKFAIACTPVAKSIKDIKSFRDLPRRSVELWLNPDDIDPIALLGSTTPRRDLGLHRFSRGDSPEARSNHTYVLSEPSSMPDNLTPPMGDSTPIPSNTMPGSDMQQMAALVEQLPVIKQLQEILPLLMSLINQAPGMGGGPEDEDMLKHEEELPEEDMEDSRGEDEEGEEEEGEPEEEEVEEEEEEEKPNKKNAAHCGPNNTYLASSKMSRKRVETPEEVVNRYARKYGYDFQVPVKKKAKFSKPVTRQDKFIREEIDKKKVEQERTSKIKLQRENEALKKQLEELQEKSRIAEVTGELRELDELGVAYDAEIEIPVLVKLSKEDREKRIAYIKKIATGSKAQLPVNPLTPESQAQVKFSREGGAVSESAGNGPKTFAEAGELANKISRNELTLADVLGASADFRGARPANGVVIPVR